MTTLFFPPAPNAKTLVVGTDNPLPVTLPGTGDAFGPATGGGSTATLLNALKLGGRIDGTRDEIVLCVRPIASNADVFGALTWREFS